MPVDYSKWDALELSDDSDIEVHPNVDKRSFIRAKQNQIHMERQQRRQQIETLKYERVVNDGLAQRIEGLLAALRAHADEARSSASAAGEVAFRAVMESAAHLATPEDDRPPPPPADVHQSVDQQQTTYSQMMVALLDQVSKALAEHKPPLEDGQARYDAMVAEIEGHAAKVAGLQAELVQKLHELEHVEASKITSDDIHTGFDSSFVNKAKAGDSDGRVELLNPNYGAKDKASAATTTPSSTATTSSSAAAGATDDDDVAASASPLARAFGDIPLGDHAASLAFIRAHPEVVAEREEEGLLLLAFDAEFSGQPEAARRCVHQATLLEFCRALGRDGVDVFFSRITTPGHQAQAVFAKDVQEKYDRIRTRVRELNTQKAATAPENAADGVEQIQLHAVEPGTVINIRIPPQNDDDPQTKAARAIFDKFKPDMRAALESGSLDKVNEVLGRMPVDEAEALVGEFGEAGILSLEDEIIDATTEEGKAHLRELGREGAEEEAAATAAATAADTKDKAKAKAEPEEEFPDPE